MVYCDASHRGLGGVLMQGNKVIAYASRQLRKHEKNYTTQRSRQRRWFELFSYCDYELKYHPGKANVVADALSWKERLRPSRVRALRMIVQTSLKCRIIKAQDEALKEENLVAERLYNAEQKFEVWADGVRYMKGRAWILKIGDLKDRVLNEAHRLRYLIYPGADKMYQDIKEYYWWAGM
nr:hypothetical protein [Tanacetum cinerariifolium]